MAETCLLLVSMLRWLGIVLYTPKAKVSCLYLLSTHRCQPATYLDCSNLLDQNIWLSRHFDQLVKSCYPSYRRYLQVYSNHWQRFRPELEDYGPTGNRILDNQRY